VCLLKKTCTPPKYIKKDTAEICHDAQRRRPMWDYQTIRLKQGKTIKKILICGVHASNTGNKCL
jgi:hypothetical protein